MAARCLSRWKRWTCRTTFTLFNIGKDEQFEPEFLKISPNNKIPAIVDQDNSRAMMESGAILWYLAEKNRQIPRF